MNENYITISSPIIDEFDTGEIYTIASPIDSNINIDFDWNFTGFKDEHVPVDKVKLLNKIKNEMSPCSHLNDDIPF